MFAELVNASPDFAEEFLVTKALPVGEAEIAALAAQKIQDPVKKPKNADKDKDELKKSLKKKDKRIAELEQKVAELQRQVSGN